MPNLHLDILSQKQRGLFPHLKFFGKHGFYLGGGTALALYLGHRTSLDFDFYKEFYFDSRKFSQEIEDYFGKEAKINLREKETIFAISPVLIFHYSGIIILF